MERILCYDNDLTTAEAIQALLKGAGFEVELLDEAANLTSTVENGGFDIVFLDAAIPGVSIPDIVKGHIQWDGISLVLMSHRPIPRDKIAELKNAGISDILMKPFTKEEIIRTVQRIVEQRGLAADVNKNIEAQNEKR